MSVDAIVNFISKGPKVMIVVGSIAISYLILTEILDMNIYWAIGPTCFIGASIWLAYDHYGPKIKDRFFMSKTDKFIDSLLRDIDAEMELILFQAKNQMRAKAPDRVKLATKFNEYIKEKEKEIDSLEVEDTRKKEIRVLVASKMQRFSGNMDGVYSNNAWMYI